MYGARMRAGRFASSPRRVSALTTFALVALAWWSPAAVAAGKPAKTVYKVPASIKSNCSAAVDGKIMDWLATVPDGATAQFGEGRCYGQDGSITLSGRRGLVIDGRGSEFRALTPGGSHRSNWRFVNGANLTVRDLAVRGSNPRGGYEPGVEWQHGFSVEGVQGMTLSDVSARETWGDGVYLWRGAPSPACGDDASSARDVLVTGAVLERIGRQGVAVVDAERVTVEESSIGPVAWWGVDVETDDDCEIARHVTVTRNTFGATRYGVVGNVGFGGAPQVGHVTVTHNVQTEVAGAAGECWAPVWALSPDGLYREGYTVRDNTFIARWNAFEFRRARDVDVGSNTVTFVPTAGCSPGAGVFLVDSHRVGITGNTFSGARDVYVADGLSTGITSEGNTTE
jgi:hypothetical protein